MLVVVAAAQPNEAAARRLARRALGPVGAEVPLLMGVAPPEVGGEAPGDGPWPVSEAIACLEAGSTGDWRLAVVLGLAEDRCAALCLARD